MPAGKRIIIRDKLCHQQSATNADSASFLLAKQKPEQCNATAEIWDSTLHKYKGSTCGYALSTCLAVHESQVGGGWLWRKSSGFTRKWTNSASTSERCTDSCTGSEHLASLDKCSAFANHEWTNQLEMHRLLYRQWIACQLAAFANHEWTVMPSTFCVCKCFALKTERVRMRGKFHWRLKGLGWEGG